MKFNQRLLVLLCLLGLSTLLSSTSVANSPAASVKTPGIKDASNMLYHGIYEHKGINLKNGKWSGMPFVQGGASRPTAGLIKDFTFTGDLNGDGVDERVVFLWESSGGSGTRIYIAVLGVHNNKLVNVATHLVGDRVQLQMGHVIQGKIELDVVQAGRGDAACCPTNKVLRTWSLRNKQLIENKAKSLGRFSLADLEGVQWTLTQMNRRDHLPENITITLTINGDKVSGRSGCNRYFAGIKEGKMPGDIEIGQAAGTRMACPGEAMELESRFLKALSNVIKYSFVNGRLALTYKDADAISTMLFTAQKVKSE